MMAPWVLPVQGGQGVNYTWIKSTLLFLNQVKSRSFGTRSESNKDGNRFGYIQSEGVERPSYCIKEPGGPGLEASNVPGKGVIYLGDCCLKTGLDPRLSRIALDISSAKSLSADYERIFSLVELIVSSQRYSLSLRMINIL